MSRSVAEQLDVTAKRYEDAPCVQLLRSERAITQAAPTQAKRIAMDSVSIGYVVLSSAGGLM